MAGFKMVNSRFIVRSLVVILAVSSLAGCNRAQETKDSIDTKLSSEVTLGSTRQGVQNWIVKQGWTPKYVAHDKGRSGRPTMNVQVRLTTQTFPITGDTFIEFVFDSRQRLQSYSTEELLTGP